MTDGEAVAALAMRSVLGAGRIGGRGGEAIRAALSALWLGVLNEKGLRALDERYYSGESVYRTASWNERGLWPWEEAMVREHVPVGGRIVVPACGGGREVLALLRAGYDAAGYESHPALVEYAQAFLAGRGHPDQVGKMERDRFPVHAGEPPWDGVLVGWGAYSLISPRTRRISFLRDALAATPPSGRVMVSVFSRSDGGFGLSATARGANLLRRLRGGAPIELGDTLAPNRVHVFAREELEGEMRAAGLGLVGWRVVGTAATGVDYACAIGRR